MQAARPFIMTHYSRHRKEKRKIGNVKEREIQKCKKSKPLVDRKLEPFV